MKAFRTAIAGLGKIGFECDVNTAKKYVLSYAKAFSLHKGFELAAGFDIDRSKLDAFEEKYRVPGYHYKDLKKNLSDIDAVVISTPSENHFEVFKKVVSSCKPRMIIMEKPLALNLKQAREIVTISKKKKILLYVNYFRRVDPGISKLKQYIVQKKWGRLKHVDIFYGQDLLSNGSHFIDLMIYLLGNPERVKLLRSRDRNNPDFIFYYKQILIFFKSSIGIDYYLKDMDFVFENSRVRYSRFSLTQLMLPTDKSCFGVKELIDVSSKDLHLDVERYMLTVAGHIYNVLSGKGKLVSTGQTALQTLEVCFDIMKKGTKA